MNSKFKNPDETDEDFWKRVLTTADELGIKYEFVGEGQGGLFVSLPDGSSRKFTIEDLWSVI